MDVKNLFHKKNAIIFDFDGTIADSFSLHEAAFQSTLQPYNLRFAYKDYLGMSTREAFKKIFTDNGFLLSEEELQPLVKQKQSLANQAYCTSLTFIPDALEFIELLYESELDLYVGSSGSRINVHAGLKALGIDQYFAGVVTSDDITRAKPHPEVFETVMRTHEIKPASALVIEDAESGIAAGLAARVDVVCIETELTSRNLYEDKVRFLSFSQLIQEFKFHVQYKKSTSGHRYL